MMLKLFAFIFVGLLNLNAALHASTQDLLRDYRILQTKLAYDELEDIHALGQKLSDGLENALKNNSSNQALLMEMQTATKAFISTTGEAELRIQFGKISRPLVELIRNTSELQSQWQLFFCPMFPQGYAFWVQAKGEKLTNPYWGKKMLHCGVKKPW